MDIDIQAKGLRRVEHIMGMPIEVDVRDEDIEVGILDRVFDWFRFVDATFSTYKTDSDISRFNRGELELDDADPNVRSVLARCEQLRFETQGYFDIQASPLQAEAASVAAPDSAVDPSGFVKGWSVDRAGRLLDDSGARNFCINAGGDVLVRGRPAPDGEWRIGIRHPTLPDRIAKAVSGKDLVVATSGAYERGQHIVDPHSGRAPSGLLSVTVVGPELGTADAYATAAFAMGRDAPSWIGNLPGYESMIILDDDTVLSTMGFPSATVE